MQVEVYAFEMSNARFSYKINTTNKEIFKRNFVTLSFPLHGNFQKSKIEHQKPSGLMEPFFVPEWKWDGISMDFVSGLPRTAKNCDSIWVIVDRLMKSAHFIPIRIDYPMERLAELYVEKIVSLHGIPSSIVSDRDPRLRLSSRRDCKKR